MKPNEALQHKAGACGACYLLLFIYILKLHIICTIGGDKGDPMCPRAPVPPNIGLRGAIMFFSAPGCFLQLT